MKLAVVIFEQPDCHRCHQLVVDAAGERSDAVARGAEWLAITQLPDGGWDEPYYTGTGFPRDFYLNYHLYRLAFPISALGRYVRGTLHD